MSKRLIAAVIAFIFIMGGAAAVASKKRAVRNLPPPAQAPRPVRAGVIGRGVAYQVVQTAAVVRADSASVVAAQIGGTILDVRVREGDSVRAGETLARIEARSLSDSVDAAEARLSAARRARAVQQSVLARDEALLADGAISKQAFDFSEAQLESARASEVAAERALSTARVQQAYAAVVAPYAGVITARMAEPGDLAAPGKPLFAIDRPGTVRVISKLSQESLRRIHPGADVVLSWGEQTLRSRVARVYPALDANFLGSVETILPSSPFGLPNGAEIHAQYSGTAVEGLTVPNDALFDLLDGPGIVRIVSGRAEPTPVRILARGSQQSVIDGSVQAGDVVVIGLPSELMALTKGAAVAPSPGRS